MNDPTTCARGCTHHGQHVTECANDECNGCLPRTTHTGNYCHPCALKIGDALNQVDALANYLNAIPDGKLAPRASDPTNRRATKVNQRTLSPAYDELNEVQAWAYGWALTVADEQHHKGPFTYRNDGIPNIRDLTTTIRYLNGNLEHALAAYWHADFYNEATKLAARLEHITGHDNLTHRLPERCPSCDHKTLTREDGDDKVVCVNRGCRRVWTETEYGRLAVVAAS